MNLKRIVTKKISEKHNTICGYESLNVAHKQPCTLWLLTHTQKTKEDKGKKKDNGKRGKGENAFPLCCFPFVVQNAMQCKKQICNHLKRKKKKKVSDTNRKQSQKSHNNKKGKMENICKKEVFPQWTKTIVYIIIDGSRACENRIHSLPIVSNG